MHIFFSVGEPSGDQHAAHLIRAVRERCPTAEFSGYGGPLMQAAGCRLDFRLTDLAVMGIIRVLPLLWKFIGLVRQARRQFEQSPPDAVVLVDFPGFNWWIARKAKAAGIPVFYYVPPQIWAWASWRIRRMRRFVDHVICTLPFEQKWYADRGVEAEYVGHPFFDEVHDHPLDQRFMTRCRAAGAPLVALLPGSRNGEVTRNWPVLQGIMRQLHARQPQAKFLVACFKPSHRAWCERHLERSGEKLPVEFCVGRTPEIIEIADCCAMVSGSVSLEVLARRTPAVVVYRAGFATWALGELLIHCDYITLPNLMAGREIMPEFPFFARVRHHTAAVVAILDGWLAEPEKRQQTRDELGRLADDVGRTGATGRAAEFIVKRLESPQCRRDAA